MNNLEQINKMKKNINSSGGLFCQYRPCRIDGNTIYDIENIIHGVVYARSPIHMNDPFDSVIGFSTEKVIDELIDMVVFDAKSDYSTEKILRLIIKNKMLGRLSEIIRGMNILKEELKIFLPKELSQQQTNYIKHHIESTIKKLPKNMQKFFNKKNIDVVLTIILAINAIEITEENIEQLLNAQNNIDKMITEIERLKEEKFDSLYRQFLSSTNISCFTASGWNNALMWSHYANSYGGICIEYDFKKINNFVGFIGAVNYTNVRPLISMKDFGIVRSGKFKTTSVTDDTAWHLIKHFLIKDKVWSYEKEWRIIVPQNIADSPSFISLPFINSITLGTNVEPIIKNWIISICDEKNIDCYQLKLSSDTYGIDRTSIDVKNYDYDINKDSDFLDYLSGKLFDLSEKISLLNKTMDDNLKENKFDYNTVIDTLKHYEDIVIYGYYVKITINRVVLKNKEVLQCFGDGLKEIAKNIDLTAEQKSAFLQLKSQTMAFFINESISYEQKCILDKKLDDIINIIDYYSEKKWEFEV